MLYSTSLLDLNVDRSGCAIDLVSGLRSAESPSRSAAIRHDSCQLAKAGRTATPSRGMRSDSAKTGRAHRRERPSCNQPGNRDGARSERLGAPNASADSQDDSQGREPWRTTADVSGLRAVGFHLERTSADVGGLEKRGLQDRGGWEPRARPHMCGCELGLWPRSCESGLDRSGV